MESADVHPNAVVVRTNLSPSQRRFGSTISHLQICQFESDDFEDEWTYEEEDNTHFWLHVRRLFGAVSDWPNCGPRKTPTPDLGASFGSLRCVLSSKAMMAQSVQAMS